MKLDVPCLSFGLLKSEELTKKQNELNELKNAIATQWFNNEHYKYINLEQ